MQSSVPSLANMADEPDATFEMYGPDSRKPGSYAANCILARRLAERGVRFIQLFHRGWDQHGTLPRDIRMQCQQTDQPSAALVRDLEQRAVTERHAGGLGRRVPAARSTLKASLPKTTTARDHHPRCFTVWLAGGGIKPGVTYGETDDFSYNVIRDGVDVHDLHRHHPALPGHGPHQAHLQIPGVATSELTDVRGRVIRDYSRLKPFYGFTVSVAVFVTAVISGGNGHRCRSRHGRWWRW